jgi:hypothetical protein
MFSDQSRRSLMHVDRMAQLAPYSSIFNLTGGPALVLPVMRTSAGLSLGVQLGGDIGSDQQLLALGAQLEVSNSRYAQMGGDAGTKSTLCALAAHVLSCYPHHTVIDVPGPDLPCCTIEEALLACLKQVLGCCRLTQVATFN